MHSLILITAMSASAGMFGGKHCGGGKMHHKAAKGCYSSAPAPMATCGAAYAAPMMHSAPASYAPAASPQSAMSAAPAAPSKMGPGAMPTPSSPIPPAPAIPPAAGDGAPPAPPVPAPPAPAASTRTSSGLLSMSLGR